MKSLIYVLTSLVVIGLAFWAYRENYATQEVLKETRRLQREIGKARARLNVLHAEWAYLNRPDRLRELADLNFESLRLMPITAEDFAEPEQVVFPKLDLGEIRDPVDLIATFDGVVPEVPE